MSLYTDSIHYKINIRKYFDQTEKFGPDTSLGDAEGSLFLSEAATDFWKQKPLAVQAKDFAAWLDSEVLPSVRDFLEDGLIDEPISSHFVPPCLSTASYFNISTTIDEDQISEEVWHFDTILDTSDNLLIIGKPEYGKTTLLKQIALSILSQNLMGDERTLPIFINFSDIKGSTNWFPGFLRKNLPSFDDVSFNLSDLLQDGRVTFLIDDYNPDDEKAAKYLEKFIDSNPKCRYFLSFDVRKTDTFGAAPEITKTVPFTNLYIRQYTRKETRAFISKWDMTDGVNIDNVLDNIVNDAKHINLPLTAVTATLLMTVKKEKADFVPINSAVLVERYVETLLEKYSTAEIQRRQFDFRNKTHFLSYIAKSMVDDNKYIMTRNFLLKVCKSYFDQFGLEDVSENLIRDFINSKILIETGDGIKFRYRVFLEYFIALQMLENTNFRDYVLRSDRYLSFANEIELYAGLRRNDDQLLDLIGDRFQELTDQVGDEIGWHPNIEDIEKITSKDIEAKERMFDEIERQLNVPRLTDEERDEILEADIPDDVDARQEVFRPIFGDSSTMWNYLLILYSGVLKNSELVADSLKRNHLGKIISAWSQFTLQSLVIVPTLAKHRKMKINGVFYYVNVPKTMSDQEVARSLYLNMPLSVANLVKQYLGTEKLSRQLAEPDLQEQREPLIAQFYRGHLYADLKLDGFVRVLGKLSNQMGDSAYLLESHLRKLRNMHFLMALEDDEEKELRGIIGKVVEKIVPGKKIVKKAAKSKEIQKLAKSRLLERIKVSKIDPSENPSSISNVEPER